MRASLTIQNALISKIKLIHALKNVDMSAMELSLLSKLIQYSVNNSITLDSALISQIKSEINIKDSAYSTSMYRLEKKNCLTRRGKAVTLNPVYKGIGEYDEILIRFSSPDQETKK